MNRNRKPAFSTSLTAIRIAVLCAALFFLLLGYFSGGSTDVLTKAVNICTECIGLG